MVAMESFYDSLPYSIEALNQVFIQEYQAAFNSDFALSISVLVDQSQLRPIFSSQA